MNAVVPAPPGGYATWAAYNAAKTAKAQADAQAAQRAKTGQGLPSQLPASTPFIGNANPMPGVKTIPLPLPAPAPGKATATPGAPTQSGGTILPSQKTQNTLAKAVPAPKVTKARQTGKGGW